ncbi:calmodulin-lysine N-methyltransferase [Anopheles nili]|uniref:calmodulin-lysine N-methyltransferase n=1 Tax=Anopheles nili TaxID=185578 RepID=UPI00237C2F5B|nr:calmodulin-lysine N-methyltransferase [Anopheles nili]
MRPVGQDEEREPDSPAANDRWCWRRHEDDINWKMSTQQQVTPTDRPARDGDGGPEAPADRDATPVAVDGENNPIKSLRRQRRHCDTAGTLLVASTASITGPTMPIACDIERPVARLRRIAAIGSDDEDDEDDEDDGDGDVQSTPTDRETDGEGINSPGHDTTNNNHGLTSRFSEASESVSLEVGTFGGDGTLEQKHNSTVNARRRWKLLARALRHDSSEDDQFAKFNLIEADRAGDEKDDNVYVYRLYDRYRLKIRLIGPERPWTASELIGFNNTGNICVWPSEEALAYYVLSRLPQFDGTKVLELGGGMTCLAGLVLAKYGQPAFVHVTDGNELSVENVRKSLVLNKFNCTIKSSVLKWEQTTQRELDQSQSERYHFILSADCLFFDESRSLLIDTIWHSLADEGVALITAPRRGHTLSLFLNECVARGFHYELLQCYNEAIWARHLELKQTEGYDENVHYPLLVKMYKYAQGSVLHRL